MRVLIVDDEADIRMLLSMSLGLGGHFDHIDEAANGALAIESARENHPDLVVLDLMMPVVGGIEALPQIRAASPGAKVAIYSAASSREMVSLRDLGADLILGKDRELQDVIDALTNLTLA